MEKGLSNEQIQRRIRMHCDFQVQCANVHEIDHRWGGGWSGQLLADGLWRCYVHAGPGASLRLGRRRQIPIAPGFCYLVPPGDRLSVAMRGRCQQLYLHVREDDPLGTFAQACRGAVQVVACSGGLTAIIDACRQACETDDAVSALLLGDSVFRSALAAACRELPRARRALLHPPQLDSALVACLAMMDADPASDWSNAVLARRSGCHIDVFIRRFRQAVGTTPARWLWQRRLRLAADLLTGSGLTLDAIAECAGFHDRSHLIRRFRAAFGCTPDHWRRHVGAQSVGQLP